MEKEPKKRGRKELYTEEEIMELLPTIEQWGREGLIDSEIAKRLGMGLSTLYLYKNKYPELAEALKRAKAEADFVIKESLYQKAKGFYYYETEELYDKNGNLVKTWKYKKYSPPDTKAILTWLQNREPEEWREKKDISVNGISFDVIMVGDEDDEPTEDSD